MSTDIKVFMNNFIVFTIVAWYYVNMLNLKYSRVKSYVIMISANIASNIIILLYMLVSGDIYPEVRQIILFSLFLLAAKFLSTNSFISKFFIFFSMLFSVAIAETFVIVICIVFQGYEFGSDIQMLITNYSYLILLDFILLIIYVIYVKYFKRVNWELYSSSFKRNLAIFSIFGYLAVYTTMLMFLELSKYHTIAYVTFIVVVIGIILVRLQVKSAMKKEEVRVKENNMIQDIENCLNKQWNQILNQQQEINLLENEIKKKINDYEKVKFRNTDKKNEVVVYSEDYLENAILNVFSNRFKDKKYQYSFNVETTQVGHLTSTDRIKIISNILRNADEAHDKKIGELRYESKVVKGNYTIFCSNSIKKRRKLKKLISGEGLNIVNETIKKYGGSVHIEKTKQSYSVLIMIPLP